MSDEAGQGKIHIDDDWKAEAEQNKERLAAAEEGAGEAGMGDIPPASLPGLINILAMPAAMYIGGAQTPDGQMIPADIGAAKFHIDMLGVLEEKTKGNLTDEERQMLSAVLYELRMRFAAAVNAPPPAPAKE
jgi:hypothetical protein